MGREADPRAVVAGEHIVEQLAQTGCRCTVGFASVCVPKRVGLCKALEEERY